jgi:hypothetical protein
MPLAAFRFESRRLDWYRNRAIDPYAPVFAIRLFAHSEQPLRDPTVQFSFKAWWSALIRWSRLANELTGKPEKEGPDLFPDRGLFSFLDNDTTHLGKARSAPYRLLRINRCTRPAFASQPPSPS